MGWFGKKEKKIEVKSSPQLSEIPKLPDLPKIGNDINELPQLPSYPSNSLGKKLSQNVIKDAVSGDKEGEKGGFEAKGSFPRTKEITLSEPPLNSMKKTPLGKKDFSPEIRTEGFIKTRTKEAEPIFVRMDKFQESLEIFENAKKKVLEIEKYLSDVKDLREKEERELREWENEIQIIKKQFEKIDHNLFSKI